jgi:hypothetical protein
MSLELTATEVLGAFQLKIITAAEARERLGFANIPAEDAPVPPAGAEGVFVQAATSEGVSNG